MESPAESEFATWSAPPCPFAIEYTPRVLYDIRLAVLDAFFSLPRGAEIGGILLGRHEADRLLILDHVALPCEHAAGPSFVLSPTDHIKLAEMLAVGRGNPSVAQPVGWYHSLTRSGILLSETDLEIHKRYFPEPWQVALVLKPHTFQPTRAGFFFREPDGAIRATCYREFDMEPLAVREIPEAGTAASGTDAPQEPAARPPALPVPERPPALPMRVRRWWLVAAAVLVPAFGGWGYYLGTLRQAPAPYVGLNTADAGGQLQIRWDRNSPAVRGARDGILTIVDGPAPEAIALDPIHLQAGAFTYVRKGARIDVAMTLNEPDGRKVREATSYLGTAPQRQAAEDNPALRKERDDLTRSLELERERNRKLEQQLHKAKRKR